MTKKNFVSLALHLAEVRNADVDGSAMWAECVNAVSDACSLANPAFDRERFKEACTTWQAGIRDGRLVRLTERS